MGLLTILKKVKQKEKELRILILGLDNAGKNCDPKLTLKLIKIFFSLFYFICLALIELNVCFLPCHRKNNRFAKI